MRRVVIALGVLSLVMPARAQLLSNRGLVRKNQNLAGRILDFTGNHGEERRLYSPILGMRRDLYVYLPPGYTPSKAYPLILYFHGAFGDEHSFLDDARIEELDELILAGVAPPCIVACPDGGYTGRNFSLDPQSFYINGRGGRFEDHVLFEVLPFLTSNFSIRPEREAHAIHGYSSGAFGALSIAIRHRHLFGSVAVIGPPANLRYTTYSRDSLEDFNPATYRWQDRYNPRGVIGIYLFGLVRLRARTFVGPIFGPSEGVIERIARVNPADVLFTSGLRPDEMSIYIHYPGRDNFNFDAQTESFAWLASRLGIAVTLECDPDAYHELGYFRRTHSRSWRWLASHILPPVDRSPSCRAGTALRPRP
jgi:S-formylglutathione hydrolase FrmB